MLRAIRSHLRAQISEIEKSVTLRSYGVALSVVNVVSYLFMVSSTHFKLAFGGWPVCWPFFNSCGALREWPSLAWTGLFFVFLAMGIWGALLFLRRDLVRIAYVVLAAATGLKYFLFIQDYQFMGNYHYMPFLTTLAYLLFPAKLRTIPVLTVLYYVAAGVLKFNSQWLGGDLMSRPPFLTRELFGLACTYVVLLETLLVWGLLSANRKVRWTTFGQFVLFHAFSYHWVGYFYPSVMLSLIAIFPLAWVTDESPKVPLDLRGLPRSSLAGLVAFALVQVIPFLYQGDSAVTGQGRLYSINMYDARTECYDVTILRYKDHSVEASAVIPTWYAPRVHCDPLVYLSEIRELCARESQRPDFIDADLALYSKRTTEAEYRQMIHVRDACHKRPVFRLAGENKWVDP